MDLVDVFATPRQPPSDRQWNAAHPGDTDPWDSLGEPLVNQDVYLYRTRLQLSIMIIVMKILPKLFHNIPEM